MQLVYIEAGDIISVPSLVGVNPHVNSESKLKVTGKVGNDYKCLLLGSKRCVTVSSYERIVKHTPIGSLSLGRY